MSYCYWCGYDDYGYAGSGGDSDVMIYFDDGAEKNCDGGMTMIGCDLWSVAELVEAAYSCLWTG